MLFKEITLPNGIIYNGIPAEGEWVGRRSGKYESQSLSFLLDRVEEVEHFFDVGAFCGYYGLHACSKGVPVTFFEPNTDCCNTIKKSLLKNNFSDGKVKNYAVSNRDGTYSFSYGKTAGFYRGKKKGGIKKSIITLNNFLTCPSMVKIDVEGMEREVLEGIVPMQHMIKYMIIEFHPMYVSPSEIEKTLGLLEGFKLKQVSSNGNPFKDNANINYRRI